MASFNILSAIKVNAAALADAAYVEEALPYIKVMEDLFNSLKATFAHEKAATTTPIVEAAKETIPPVLSDEYANLSSQFPLGSSAFNYTTRDSGIVVGYLLSPQRLIVELSDGIDTFLIADVTPF